MKRLSGLATIVGLLLMVMPAAVFAAPMEPEADTYINSAAPTTPSTSATNILNSWGQSSLAACTPSRASLIRWNLSGFTTGVQVDRAVIHVKVNYASGTTGGMGARMSLYKVANDTWDESTLTWNSSRDAGSPVFDPLAPPLGDKLGETALPDSCGPTPECTSVITFDSGTNAPELDLFVKEALTNVTDKRVSFALMVTGACGLGTVGVRTDSKESSAASTAGATPQGRVPPTLEVFSPTAITQSIFLPLILR